MATSMQELLKYTPILTLKDITKKHDFVKGNLFTGDLWVDSKDLYNYSVMDKLPFNKIFFSKDISKYGEYVEVEELENGHSFTVIKYLHGKLFDMVVFSIVGDTVTLHSYEYYAYNDDPNWVEVYKEFRTYNCISSLQNILCIIHSGCEAKLCRMTDKQKRINERRIKDGKKPVYEEQTIKIKPSVYYKPTGQRRGYTPPCAHQRRGHFRTYPSGKRGWVKDCKVSQGSERTVKSNYVFEYDVV